MSEALLIEQTEETPKIRLDKKKGIFEFSGQSLPEDAPIFFAPVYQWIKEYCKDPLPETKIVFNLDYFNTSSARKIVEILKELEKAAGKGHKVRVIWKFARDDEMIESKGKELQHIIDLPVELVPF
ncbi:MAG: DUF1987 domain-containing protein [Bacteroidetes bacterium]|nr:DUF1987 domain-containing protein [Bacteroidota bacterium]